MRTRGNTLRNYLSAFSFLLIGCSFVSAQQLVLTIDRDSIGFNQTATITLSGEAKDISSFAELPETDGVVVIGRSSNYSFNGNNGKIKLNQTFTLQPIKTGTFSIGPAWVQTGSKRIFSNKVSLTVSGGAAASPSNTVFLRCEPDKKNALLGEQIVLSIRLYHRVDVRLSSERPYAKTFNGFWYHSGPMDQTYKDTVITLNGLKYVGETLYKEFVFPNATGKLKIPSYEYSCSVKQNPFPTGDNLIDDLMGIETPVQLHSEEVPIEVSPLPDENRPADFSGDVGKLYLSATLDRSNVKANEAVKLAVTISGSGNISFIQLPAQKFPDEIESFPPVSTDSSAVSASGVEGSKTFSITLIPKKEGNYTIPGITFSYYDPKKKEYVTLNTPEFNLKVAPGDPVKNVTQNNLPDGFLSDTGSSKSVLRILLIVVPQLLLIVVLIVLFRRRKRKNAKETVVEKSNVEAQPIARKTDTMQIMIHNVETNMLAGNYSSAVSILYEALMTACCSKCELTREEASVHQLRYRMKFKKIDDSTIDQIMPFLEDLSMLRFGGFLDRTILFEKLQKTRDLISKLSV